MNKSELIAAVYAENENDIASKAAAERIVNSVFDNIVKEAVKCKPVRLDKFGTFELVQRAARDGVNPQTGEKMKIEAKKAIKYSPAKAVKEAAAASKAKID